MGEHQGHGMHRIWRPIVNVLAGWWPYPCILPNHQICCQKYSQDYHQLCHPGAFSHGESTSLDKIWEVGWYVEDCKTMALAYVAMLKDLKPAPGKWLELDVMWGWTQREAFVVPWNKTWYFLTCIHCVPISAKTEEFPKCNVTLKGGIRQFPQLLLLSGQN